MKLYGKLNLQLNINLKLIKYCFLLKVWSGPQKRKFHLKSSNNNTAQKNSVAINVEMTKVNILAI